MKTQKSAKEYSRKVKTEGLENLKQINLNAAGLDIGDREIYACVPQDRDENPVQVFKTFTAILYHLADWLTKCGITTVAMESTGVYWIPIFQILEERGFEVLLVNAQHIKNVPGKKTDVLDCQWIQQLHTYGLLRGSFRPNEQTCVLRSYVRHREMLIQSRSSHIQHMQKALQQMNLKLTNVVSDITGKTGMSIIRDILAGERDPAKLAQHRYRNCAKSEGEIAESLVGDYREEHLFSLKQAVELYDVYNEKLKACEIEIEQQLARFSAKISIEENPLPPRKKNSRPKNHPEKDIRSELYQISGVDLTEIEGVDVITAQVILSEIGVDMNRWKTVKHFTSWLGLCPHNEKTGGKVIRTKTKKTNNRANVALRQAAITLRNSRSGLGQFYRRMRTKMGAPKAVVATAHKLARIVYHMLKHQVAYRLVSAQEDETRYRERAIRELQLKAERLGGKLIFAPLPETA